MKKIICMILCLLLTAQFILVPAAATETELPTEAVVETLPSAEGETAPQAEYGLATILNGCRTLDAQEPLGGSNPMLDTAVSAFVYERNTGTVVYAYNPDLELQPGTLTKIVAAIVAIENGDLAADVTISSRNYKYLPAGAKNSKLKEGEVMTLRDLLYCMFLEWANDAAVTIAEHIANSQDSFVKKMNEWVDRVGCTNTRFTDCHGLGSEGQSTTARDMARIVEEALKNEDFRELFCAKAYTVPETNRSDARALKSLNYLIEETIVPQHNYKGATGGLAHYTEFSGASLVCTAENKGMSYTVVVMGCKRVFNKDKSWVVESYGNYEEAWVLLDYAFDNYKICRLLHEGQSMAQFPVAGGENDVVAQTHVSKDAILPASARLDNLILKYSVVGGGLKAPLEKDQNIANLQIWYRTSCVAEAELYAMSPIRAVADLDLDIQGAASRDDSNLPQFLSLVGSVCLVILVPLTVYLVVNHTRRILARNRRRRRRTSRRRSR